MRCIRPCRCAAIYRSACVCGRTPKREVQRRVEWASRLLQIEDLLDRKPSQLSGGQRQRVAIGRALVQQAKVFLFDEPLSNLDAKLRTEMRVELKRLHKELGATIIYVTHDQIEAMTLATRIAVMRAGRIEQYAMPEALYEQPETLFVAGFVGSPAMNFLAGELVGGPSPAARFGSTLVPLNGYRSREHLGAARERRGRREAGARGSRRRQRGRAHIRGRHAVHGADGRRHAGLVPGRRAAHRSAALAAGGTRDQRQGASGVRADHISLFDPSSEARL